ncbi:PIG-X [Parachaetomium inaequale]|uniref:Protein PBN1 n=1 Tax=Parachaetomium inaequale TaxID=2588326 RepID=A0AAN6PDY6_9PEZI|nr:PIG-X [Parachaetomium inaequale]
MRERITYVQKLGDSLEPSAVTVDGGALRGPEVHAVREDRLTIALDELPLGLQTLVTGTRDLHIRWVGAAAYEAVSPLLARLPPGFHLFFTPGKDDAVSNKLCSTLGDIFGDISCSTPAESFTSIHKDRFQYFQELGNLSHFVQYAKDQLCRPTDASCPARLDTLSKAASLDISYDTAQKVLRVTALGPYQRQRVHATSHPNLRTEVGILSTDRPKTLEAHEIGISGLLTVLGQDSKPSPTMFSFASRHRDVKSAFSAQFLAPTGLHPTLQLRLTSNNPFPSPSGDDDDTTCTPYAYLTLPRTIFADKYQLADPLFLASKNLTALRHTTQPVDLEAPEYVMSQWGSAVLLQLSPPPPPPSQSQEKRREEEEWTAEIPLHLRYLAPTRGGYSTVSVPYPAVFWACEPQQQGAVAFPPNPFENGDLGYDGLFEEGTVFWHVEPRPVEGGRDGLLVSRVRVPVLDLERAGWVNAGTAAAVVVGFAWVVWKLVGVCLRGGVEGERERVKKRQ